MNFIYNTFLTSLPTIEFLILRSLPAAHHEEVCDYQSSAVSYRSQHIIFRITLISHRNNYLYFRVLHYL